MKHGKKISVWASPVAIRKFPFPKDLVSKSQAFVGSNGVQNKSADYVAISKNDIRALADLATNLWRAKQRLVGLIEKGSPVLESKKILRPIDSALENLENIGVKIEDYTGQPFVLGMALNVISSQPNSSILSDRICETLKPTIYFRNHFIQAGDVIIEGPPSSSSPSQQS